MTTRLYRDDPYLLEFEAHVVARREHQGRPAVILDQTAFYAESGGQPWDAGRLDEVAVVAVIESGDDVLHVLGAPLASDHVHGHVEADRRRDHRQQHHGQHLLSRAFLDLAHARTVSFHLGAESSSIDLDRDVGGEEVRAAEVRANGIVWEARPVTVRTVSRAEAAALGVDAPEEAGDRVRLVEARGFDLQPCGGTHPHNTSEVGVILVLGSDRYKGGSRVRFVCGHRALAAFHTRSLVLDRLGALFSSPVEGLPEAAQKALDNLTEVTRRGRDLLDRAIEGEARRLLAEATGSPAVVVNAYDGWPADELRALGIKMTSLVPCVALLGSRADKAYVVFAQSKGLPHDIPHLLRESVAIVGGRGGGKGDLAQGGGELVDRLDDALARAAAVVRGAAAGDAARP